ncbi:assimilatory sulfite reductase (NADPH) flavoprotein subunit [Dokdonella sp. MW10]|uniref:assimilatory sulfite reductase (NADPH) flavoprotein subunit n=1 Tax=Dokdonella sp. MW10 TaxID=2992926 RepID=UPI003F7DBA1B
MSAHIAAPPQVPLPEDRTALLGRLVEGLDAGALWWLSGYAAALATRAAASPIPAERHAAATATPERLTVLYGSQTGNAKRVAERLAAEATAGGLAVRLVRADTYPLRELAAERALVVVISTQGDGDPPDDARAFVEHVTGKRAPKLDTLRYAVLGLGDSSYPHFNAIGRRLDERLAELGGKRLAERGEADVDVDTVAKPWAATTLERARDALAARTSGAAVIPLRATAAVTPTIALPSRDQPFAAAVLANQRITARDGTRDIRHLELSLEGSGLHYEPGDALGVWPRNDATLVDTILATLKLDGEAAVTHAGTSHALRDWLVSHREVTRLARPFIAAHAERGGHADLAAILDPANRNAFARLLDTHQVVDLLRAWPATWDATTLVAALRAQTPRLYSIASSRKLVGDEAHLTVARVAWEAFGLDHAGAASGYLAATGDDAHVRVFVEENPRFRLPADPERDLIMIGPGTGVAPFRGFLQERAAVGARGRHWLLFGNPRFRSDFLYQLEWQEALREGRLQRLDLAFSRDQAEKIYVQHRMREHGRELFAWLDGGAHLYVCGDATRMARDVHAALVDIVAEHGGRDRDDASAWLDTLQREGRYARDVY